MRRTLATVALVLLLAGGCGDDRGGEAPGAAPASLAPGEIIEVAILTGTSAGGRVTTELTVLADEQAVRRYVERFRNDRLQGQIVRAAERARVPEDRRLAAAVVAIGCEVPTRVVGTSTGGETVVRAVLPSPTKQCLAPITSVVLVLVPA
ncbi:hypothetical protein KM427_06690 [Nocardioides sp. LMS-CY]|uniref:hypothetical protein n=1 Tax=Nocardioides sp. (strain LMS-CY) TaxID=2840457 RepID=UPI001C008432|nr:hypothetical protein [Nocardioides sp. LMS-CY]QWF23405.1 hypothetical protein KM427_06690 [Nocardioides sp. LMS-CY]